MKLKGDEDSNMKDEQVLEKMPGEAAAGAETNGHAPEPGADGAVDYTEKNFQVLRDAAHIRKRPGAYIGDTSTSGLHHLVYELVYNSVDEALGGFCHLIQVEINLDGSLSVIDDGRGIPVEPHPEIGRPILELVMTVTGAGAKFDKRAYKTSLGLHGMGAKAVTALSEWTEAEVRRNGRVYLQEYERGKPTTDIKDMGAAGHRTGTRVTFKPDPEIFRNVDFNYDTLAARFRELAFLNKNLTIKLADHRSSKEDTFKYDGGLSEFVEYINRTEDVLHKPPIYMDRTVYDDTLGYVRVEVAIQYTTGEEERVRCYTNNGYNSVGGTHLSGFRAAVTRALKDYGTKEGMFNKVEPVGEDFRDGMTAVVSVQVPEPQFESNNKLRLNNPEVEGIVAGVVRESLAEYLEKNPKEAKRVVQKVAVAAEAREAAAKAKKALRDRKSILSGGGLPGKLMDCTSTGDDSELFLVEGQSAGGTAESGRNRHFQAILPLRGKVLNVEKARPEKFLNNEEICNLISAVGVDIGDDADLDKLRYGKIVILTDADVDGQHIRTLLLTFFYRQMSKLVEQGRIFVARPPLFKITQKKTARYVTDPEEMQRELMERGLSGTKLAVLPREADGQAQAFEGDRLAGLLKVVGSLERALEILERRGLNLSTFLTRGGDRGLPMYRVVQGGSEVWFHTADEVDTFRKSKQEQLGHELVVADEAGGEGNGHGETFSVQELHEVKAVNAGLEELRQRGLSAADLLPAPRIAGREPAPRFVLQNGESKHVLPHLRDLVAEVRHLGEKGLTITRFKGLGEMGDEELWETTLDPERRTLLRVQLDDASAADDMFRTLMGEKVEPRRDFIQAHALDAKDIDIHGA
jgi:DNA gyrase subunit B